ncbi:MAG: hypothetical protein NVS2B3_12480 [Vulcanimicrobiaceae bacterium]
MPAENPAQSPAGPKPVPNASPAAATAPKPGGLAGHLPIVDLAPEATFADPGSTSGQIGGPLPGVVTGKFNLSGSVTIPIVGGLSASYDRIAGNFLNSTFARVTGADGAYREPGSLKRRMEIERLDYAFGKTGLNLEIGSQFNRFECCAPLEFHDVYTALTYATPGIRALHGTKFVLTERASTAAHHLTPGASTLDIGRREYGLTQVVTAVVPIDPHLYATGTFFNGAYDFFETAPFPFSFDLFNETANFVIDPNTTFALGFTNAWQHEQGAPFGPHNAIHFVSYYTQLKFHVDLNKIFAP